MTREVYTDREFIEFSRSQIFVRLFADTDPQGARLARKYGVHGYPTLIVLDRTGRQINRLVGARSARVLRTELESIFDEAGPDEDAAPPPATRIPPQPTRSPSPGDEKGPPSAVPKVPVVAKAPAQPGQKPADKDAGLQPTKAADEDPIARLERSLAAARDEAEIKWLRLMLGVAHFQRQHWKEARAYIAQVLEKDPGNPTALEIKKALEGK